MTAAPLRMFSVPHCPALSLHLHLSTRTLRLQQRGGSMLHLLSPPTICNQYHTRHPYSWEQGCSGLLWDCLLGPLLSRHLT